MLDLLSLLLSLCRPTRILRWALFLVGTMILWLVMENTTLQEYLKSRDRYNGYQEQVKRLQTQQQQLQHEEAQLKAGGFPAEKAIRERLGMVKPGEKIIYIQPPNEREPLPETPAAALAEPAPTSRETPAAGKATTEEASPKSSVKKISGDAASKTSKKGTKRRRTSQPQSSRTDRS